MSITIESFMDRYGRRGGTYPLFEVGATVEQWPTIVARFGDKIAVIQLCGVGADGDDPHLSIDIHPFVADHLARAAVFGMEEGRRYEAFTDGTPGTSHGQPAVQGITVLIGAQSSREST